MILFGSGVALQELDARNAEKKIRQHAPSSFSVNDSPAFNVGGSPMMDSFDIHGRPFSSVGFRTSFPNTNIDGMPMMGGGVDVCGKPFGVSSWH